MIMGKYDAKTKPEGQSVDLFLEAIADDQMRADCKALVKLMSKRSGYDPVLWGGHIVGFGKYHYTYESGHEGISCITGFAPRKGNIAVYTNMYLDSDSPLMKKLGKFKNGKSCINIKKLSDVDMEVLAKIIDEGIKRVKQRYPSTD